MTYNDFVRNIITPQFIKDGLQDTSYRSYSDIISELKMLLVGLYSLLSLGLVHGIRQIDKYIDR